MQIVLNGEPREVDEDTTLAALIGDLALATTRYAVEVNGDLVPRSEHARCGLAAGDRVEIVQAIGGG